MWTLGAALLACGALWAGAGGVRPPPVAVPRCCAPGQRLAAAALRRATLGAADVACEAPAAPAAPPPPWAPRVYRPVRGGFLDRGQLPPLWVSAGERVPRCTALRVVPEHSAVYALLATNGSLVLLRGGSAALAPERYCVDEGAALVCDEDLSWAPAKCCSRGRVLNGSRCAEEPELARAALAELANFAANGTVAVGFPVCPEGTEYAAVGALAGARAAPAHALTLGVGALAAPGAWCADAELASREVRVLACGEGEAARRAGGLRHTLYGAGLAVGAAFLGATLAAGFALPAAHHALHWRCQTHYVAALMLGDVLLAATQLAGDRVPPGLCRALAVCMHFLFLSAFFWLNTMCFNIWWTFRDFRPTSLERGQEAWRLRVYVVYAWGGPLLLAGAAWLLDAWPGAAPLLRPRFGERRCWFYGDTEILVYFFGPVGVLLAVNLALFASTARQLTCGLWRRDEVKSTSERAALGRVCAKLVVVMGVTWGADVLSWAAGGPHYLWYATDLLNALQGVFIFLVVGCQPHAWAALKRLAHACWARGGGGGGGGDGGPTTHSSTHLPSVGESLTHTTPAPPPAPTSAPTPAAARVPMETVC